MTENDDLRRCVASGQLRADPDRGPVGEIAIEQHHVGLTPDERGLHRRLGADGSHDLDVLLGLQPHGQSVGERALLVYHEDADGHGRERG